MINYVAFLVHCKQLVLDNDIDHYPREFDDYTRRRNTNEFGGSRVQPIPACQRVRHEGIIKNVHERCA